MYSKVYTATLLGLEGKIVEVETDIRNGLPEMEMVGALGTEVREAKERVRTALSNSDYSIPPQKITVNLSPSHIRKEGNSFDLPIAVSVMLALGFLPEGAQKECLFAGELGLNGDIRPVRGILPSVLCGTENHFSRFILPWDNVREAEAIGGIEIIGVRSLQEMIEYLNAFACGEGENWLKQRQEETVPEVKEGETGNNQKSPDFSDIIGQIAVRRAAEIAVSGKHNFLMVGPPGSGKTMIARRLPGILPELTREEVLEVSKVYSICGYLSTDRPLIDIRPFRSPHHTVTSVTLTGGGRVPKPGEVSLADHGILFLDELTEFNKQTLDTLRQPLEEGEITIARNQGSFIYPAHFMLVAGMNACPCGLYPSEKCTCSRGQIRQYLAHVSRPLLDRIDVCVEASAVSYEQLVSSEKGESSADIRKRVLRTQIIQQKRYSDENFHFNSEIPSSKIEQYCPLGEAEKRMMEKVFQNMSLSARGFHKILKVARTIADMEEKENITVMHLSEAIGYRSLERKFWQ